MSVDDIKFSTSTIADLYKPIEIVADTTTDGTITITVTNYGDTLLSPLGVYLSIGSNQGDVDNPADYAPHIDYQDLLTWGNYANRTSSDGGVLVYNDLSDTTTWTRIRRGIGSDYKNRIYFMNGASRASLAANSSLQFKVVVQVPEYISKSTSVTSTSNNPSSSHTTLVTARRMFVNISVE